MLSIIFSASRTRERGGSSSTSLSKTRSVMQKVCSPKHPEASAETSDGIHGRVSFSSELCVGAGLSMASGYVDWKGLLKHLMPHIRLGRWKRLPKFNRLDPMMTLLV